MIILQANFLICLGWLDLRAQCLPYLERRNWGHWTQLLRSNSMLVTRKRESIVAISSCNRFYIFIFGGHMGWHFWQYVHKLGKDISLLKLKPWATISIHCMKYIQYSFWTRDSHQNSSWSPWKMRQLGYVHVIILYFGVWIQPYCIAACA